MSSFLPVTATGSGFMKNICRICGIIMPEYKTGNRSCCSDECKERWSDIRKQKKWGKKKRLKSVRATFYESEEWRNIRYKAIKKHGACCLACGRNYKEHGIVIHVDHILPRSKYPELELSLDNLQILCRDCNLGKRNTDETDWRK